MSCFFALERGEQRVYEYKQIIETGAVIGSELLRACTMNEMDC